MRVLSRYLLRQLVLPFLFGLAALTGIMLLNVISRKFGELIGKGLPWGVIGEVLLLSLPFIVAMTLPLAVLAAVLYAFSQLAADNEVTAMRAGGVSLSQILRPVLAWAAVMAVLTFLFIDQVLPRSNARLRNLTFDIGRKRPTFALQEQVINPVPSSQYFLRASRIEPGTGRLRSVTIYDVGLADRRRVIYADSGLMAYTPDGRNLNLRLWDGTVEQTSTGQPGEFQVTRFDAQAIVVRNVFDTFERGTEELERGDREMTSCELLGVVDSARREWDAARAWRDGLARHDLRVLLDLPAAAPAPAPPAAGPASYRGLYCGAFAAVARALARETAGAAPPAQPAAPATAAAPGAAVPAPAPGVAGPSTTPNLDKVTLAAAQPPRLAEWGLVVGATEREDQAVKRADRYLVETHKKWSLSAACLPFVLIAVAMALRFPRGGMGLVLGGGMFVYAIFYVGLTAGESLADRDFVSPQLAMWSPNLVLAVLALVGLWVVNRESGSTRGGDLGELGDLLRRLLRRGR